MQKDDNQVWTLLIAGEDDQTVTVHGTNGSLVTQLRIELRAIYGDGQVCVGGVVHANASAATLEWDDLLELADNAWSEGGVMVQIKAQEVL